MTKLQSMTDFVLQVVQTPNINEATCWEQTEKRLNKIYQYALFLKQPLTLGMFVPCDGEGNVLQEPEFDFKYLRGSVGDCELEDYKKAKEKVLFEGFEIISNEEGIIELECKDIFINYNIEEGLFFLDSWNGDAVIMNLECLCNLLNNTASSVELTENSIKQIGL